ncbi:MAG: hypothetical protein ACM3XO_19305 [Bacteroidota bacterium]
MHVSIESKRQIESRLLIAFAALLAVLFYLLVSARTFRIGFPLDDAWIHLTYARNFAEHAEWAFRPGQNSAGSTSPLWTILLSVGFFLDLAPYIWPFLLGWVILTLLGIRGESVTRQLVGTYKPRVPWVGLFFVTVWHLTWSAVSGMETLLHGFIIFYILSMLLVDPRRYLALGFLTGLSVWVRPDGITLLGPLILTALMIETNRRERSNAIARILIGFSALFVPYLFFNLALSGSPWPNTFYAKQAEYQSSWLSLAFLVRLNNYLTPVLASPFIVLLPGVVMWIIGRVRLRDWAALASLIWFFGYITLYFMRLPAYQHGRYIIPAFPILYLWAILGMAEYVTSKKANEMIGRAWPMLLGVLCILFSVIAAQQNAADVQWVETEMVGTAKWIQENLPPDALLAVHDIGAIGYFDGHRIIDLAGLASPNIVPFIRDQARIAAYLDQQGVDYLVTLPAFYPTLVYQKEVVYPVNGSCQPASDQSTMCVYRWK